MASIPAVIEYTAGSFSATRSPSSVSFSSQPQAGDIVVAFPSTNAAGVTIAMPTGWSNLLGGTTDIESSVHQLAGIYRVVTAAEQTAGTKSWALTNLYSAAQSGDILAALVRGTNPLQPVAGLASTFDNSASATPHILAGLTTNVDTGLVMSMVSARNTGVYGTAPLGWSIGRISLSNVGAALCVRTAATVHNVAVPATNITPPAAGQYISLTVVWAPLPSPVANLVDGFDSALDRTVWISTSPNPNTYYDATNQRVGVVCSGSFFTLGTDFTIPGFSLTNSGISCKLVPSTPAAGRETHFQLQTPSQANVIAFLVYNLNLIATTTPGGDVASVPYNAVNHKWLRIRHASGNIIWDTSPDGFTWTQFATTAYTFTNDAWAVNFSCGGSAGGSDLLVDNVNVAAGVALAGTATGTSTVTGALTVPTSSMGGTSAGTSTATGTLSRSVALAGASGGTSTASGSISGTTATPIGTLVDAFTTQVDPAKWIRLGSAYDLSNARVRIPTSITPSDLKSHDNYSLIGSAISAQLTYPGPGTASIRAANFTIYCPNGAGGESNQLEIDISGGAGSPPFITASMTKGSATTSLASINYDPIAHQFLRYRETAGTVFFETSPDDITWTTLASVATAAAPVGLNNVWVDFGAYSLNTADASGNVYLDNVNIAPADPAFSTLRDTFSGSINPALWTPNGGAVLDSTGTRVRLPIVQSVYAQLTSWLSYKLQGSAVSAQVIYPGRGNGSREAWMQIVWPTTYLGVNVLTWAMRPQSNPATIVASYQVNGVAHEIAAVSVGAATWWRIRETGGTIFFGLSSDGKTWTEPVSIATATTGLPITTGAALRFTADALAAESASDLFVDNVNISGVDLAGRSDGTSTVIGAISKPSDAKALAGSSAGISTATGTLTVPLKHPLISTLVDTFDTQIDPLLWANAAPASTLGQFMAGFSMPLEQVQGVTDTYIGQQGALMADLGVGWVRGDYPVSLVSPTSGTFTYTAADKWIVDALGRGMQPLPVLYQLPQWMNGSTNDKTPPLDDTLFANWCATACTHLYGLGVRNVEIWNEQNLATFWNVTPINDTTFRVRFASMMAVVYPAIKAAVPGMNVILGGLSTSDSVFQGGGDTTPVGKGALSTFYRYGQLGVLANCDAVSWHPYLDSDLPGEDVGGWPAMNLISAQNVISILDTYAPARNLKLWTTETGAPRSVTGTQLEQSNRAHDVYALAMPGGQMASIRARMGPIFWFCVIDRSVGDAREDSFGFVSHDQATHYTVYSTMKTYWATAWPDSSGGAVWVGGDAYTGQYARLPTTVGAGSVLRSLQVYSADQANPYVAVWANVTPPVAALTATAAMLLRGFDTTHGANTLGFVFHGGTTPTLEATYTTDGTAHSVSTQTYNALWRFWSVQVAPGSVSWLVSNNGVTWHQFAQVPRTAPLPLLFEMKLEFSTSSTSAETAPMLVDNVNALKSWVPVQTVTDQFPASISTTTWTAAGTVAWDSAGQRARITTATPTPSSLTSKGQYTLENSYLYGRVVFPAPGNGSKECHFGLVGEASSDTGNDNSAQWVWTAATNSLYPLLRQNGVTVGANAARTPYDPFWHAWLRIRHDGIAQTLNWEASPDGEAWTPLYVASGTLPPPCVIVATAGYSTGSTPDVAGDLFLDNVDVVPRGLMVGRSDGRAGTRADLNVYSLDTIGMVLEMWQVSPGAWIPQPTCDVRNISIQRGRATYLDSFAAGSLNADLASFDGAWNAWNPSAVWQRLGGGPTSVPVRVRVVLVALDDHGNVVSTFTSTFFTGTIDKIIDHWPNIVDAVASIQATDGFKNLARHNGGPRTPVGAGELTGQRINRLADDAGWPSTASGWLPVPRRIDAGLTHVQATDMSGTTIDLMRTVGESEWGWLFMDVDDSLVFRQRDTFVNDPRMTNVQWTFTDSDIGFEGISHVCYQDLALAVDEDTIINVAQITPPGHVMSSASDATSVGRYGPRTWTRTDLPINDDTEAAATAQVVVLEYKDNSQRIESVTFEAMNHGSSHLRCATGVRINDRIRIVRHFPGDPTSTDPNARPSYLLDAELIVQGIDHQIEAQGKSVNIPGQPEAGVPGSWTVTLRTATARLVRNYGKWDAIPGSPATAGWDVSKWSL